MASRAVALVALTLAALLCAGPRAASAAQSPDSCTHRVASCNASADYFPTKIAFAHATTVTSVVYRGTHVVVEMQWTAWSGAHRETLVLVRCGCPAPGGASVPADAKTFYVPVASMLLQETVAVPKVYQIGQRAKVAAVASVQWVTTPELRDDVANGIVADIANNYTRLLALPGGVPDVLLTGSGSTAAWTGWTADMEARRILDSDAGETSPLGRAELLKLTALLTGAEDAGNTIFAMIAARYDEARHVAMRDTSFRPVVMLNTPHAGWGWGLTRGTSYVGQLLRDAAADYRNHADGLTAAYGGSLTVAQVTQYFAAVDFWVNAFYVQPDGARFTMELLSDGNRTGTPEGDRAVFAQLQAFQCARVLSNSAALIPGLPGNPFFELGVVRPDLILLDLVYYLHPYARETSTLFAAYTPTFYFQLAPLKNSAGVPACPAPLLPAIPAPTRAHMVKQLAVTGANVFAFRDALHPGIASSLALALGVDAAAMSVAQGNTSFGHGAAGEGFTVTVTVSVPACEACSGDAEATMCDVALARRVEALGPALQGAMRAAGGETLSGATVAAGEGAGGGGGSDGVLQCASRASVPLRDLRGFDGTSSGGMSGGAKAGVAVGVVAGLVVCALAALAAFKVGHRRGYNTLLAQQQPIDASMKTVHTADPPSSAVA